MNMNMDLNTDKDTDIYSDTNKDVDMEHGHEHGHRYGAHEQKAWTRRGHVPQQKQLRLLPATKSHFNRNF
jgi:hypothetical protein